MKIDMPKRESDLAPARPLTAPPLLGGFYNPLISSRKDSPASGPAVRGALSSEGNQDRVATIWPPQNLRILLSRRVADSRQQPCIVKAACDFYRSDVNNAEFGVGLIAGETYLFKFDYFDPATTAVVGQAGTATPTLTIVHETEC